MTDPRGCGQRAVLHPGIGYAPPPGGLNPGARGAPRPGADAPAAAATTGAAGATAASGATGVTGGTGAPGPPGADREGGVVGDDGLVREVARGDRGALELLYRRHAAWLAGRLAGRTSSRDLAEEALQDTFVAVWRGAGSYQGSGEVPAWLWGIARRRLASLARRQGEGLLPLEAAADPADPATGPEQAAVGQDVSARVREAVAGLPAEQRAAVTAVVYQGRSIREAAEAAGVPEGTVKSRLHRARLHIRKELGP
jgi:RNA polymerase sigma-70 factor, ECF subfamily